MMRKNANRSRGQGPAFTLIELLVSMTVLTVLVLLITQLFSDATNVTVSNRERLDADSQARVVFDRLALDFGKMVNRADVDYLFAKINGASTPGENDKMFFYSEAPAFFDTTSTTPQTNLRSSVALIGYRINKAYQLERLGKQLSWDGTVSTTTPGGVMFLSPTSAVPAVYPDPNSTLGGNWPNTIGKATDSPPFSDASDDGDYQVLAESVSRFEVCFQLKNGTFSPIPVSPVTTPVALTNKLDATGGPAVTSDSGAGYSVGSRWYDNTNYRGYVCTDSTKGAAVWNTIGTQDIRAIVVALAIIDPTSVKTVRMTSVIIDGKAIQTPKLDTFSGLLADANPQDAITGATGSSDITVPNLAAPVAPARPRIMAEAWANEIKTSDFATKSGLPKNVVAQVRIYQRSFVLNNQ